MLYLNVGKKVEEKRKRGIPVISAWSIRRVKNRAFGYCTRFLRGRGGGAGKGKASRVTIVGICISPACPKSGFPQATRRLCPPRVPSSSFSALLCRGCSSPLLLASLHVTVRGETTTRCKWGAGVGGVDDIRRRTVVPFTTAIFPSYSRF